MDEDRLGARHAEALTFPILVGLVEVAPQYDISDITSLAGATLLLEFLCLISQDLPSKV